MYDNYNKPFLKACFNKSEEFSSQLYNGVEIAKILEDDMFISKDIMVKRRSLSALWKAVGYTYEALRSGRRERERERGGGVNFKYIHQQRHSDILSKNANIYLLRRT